MAESPLKGSTGVVRLSIFSDGAQIDERHQIVSAEIINTVNKIPLARLVILDGDMPNQDFPVSNSAQFKPGAEIKINAGYDQTEQTIFQGIVVRHGIKITGDNYSRLTVECRDKSIAMTVARKNANYVDKKDSDIITSLIGSYGGLSSQVDATDTQHKELVQYYCTDWDYLIARAEVNGLLVTVDAAKLTVQAPQTSSSAVLKVAYGVDLIEFHAELDARSQLTSVKGVTWDPGNQNVVEQQAAPQTLNQQGNLSSSVLAQVLGVDAYRLQTSAPIESTALKSWADGQQIKSGLARIRGRMKFQGSALAKPGALIELSGVGDRFNGQVFVSSVSHVISDGNWITEAEFGLSPNWFVEQRDLVAPPASGVTSGIEGLQIGIVKKLESDPEGQHKVQVSVPVLQAETEGVWARLASFHGSNNFGAFFIPEINDEVVLGYVNNDPSHPVILGSFYSSNHTPPYELTAENSIKAIVTRAKLKLEFDEEKKVITLITPGNNKIVISDDAKSILLQDQNSNKVELNTDGIVLDSPKDIAIKAKGKVTVEAVGNVEVSSKADLKQEALNINNNANVGFVAKGATSAELSASGQTTVKGAMVMIN